jgi:O-succinylbenzoate synthase
MRIESFTIREIRMPLVHFFETSFGRTTERRILLVTAHCEGVDGWGECTAGEQPFYSEESIDTAWYVIESFLAPALLGANIDIAQDTESHADSNAVAPTVMVARDGGKAQTITQALSRVRMHRMAKGAVENALWDALAQQKQVPLHQLLGGTRMHIPCGVSIGIQDSVEQLLQNIESELAAGYRRIKVKVKPGWDLNVLRRIRERWPDILLSCDANSAYTLDDVEHLKRFDEFKLLMIEQPLWNDDIYFHALLQRQLQTALCLDESIHHERDARQAAELGACRIVNIKVGRVGGFTSALGVHNVCRANGIPNWCGGMLEAGIGRAHNIALSTLPNFELPGDVSASKRYWKEDIIDPAVEVSSDGMITAPQTPGRGFAIKTDLVERLTVHKREIRLGDSRPASAAGKHRAS